MFAQLAKQRYSVRKFKDTPVPKEALDAILEAGRVAPTATNAQPQRILVIQSSEALSKLRDCTPFHFEAPLALLVCYDSGSSWKRKRYDGKCSGEIDASIVTTHMMLQAEELGLGSTWVMVFDPAKIRDTFKIPGEFIPVALLPMGYPADDCQPSPRHFERLPLEETVVYNTF